jgi:uncharacterized membrane protein
VRASAAWLSRHWLAAANCVLIAYATLPVLEPLLRFGQVTAPADAIWAAYSFVCHQLPSRSYQLAGFQLAFCERDTAIYAAMAAGGLAWAHFRRAIPKLHWSVFGLLVLPMALDGFSQLFGLRESTWQLRSLTGGLFGVACVWFGFPLLDTSARLVRIGLRATTPRAPRLAAS